MIKQPETRDIIDELENQVEKQTLDEISPATIKYLCSRIRTAEEAVRQRDQRIVEIITRLQMIESVSKHVLDDLLERVATHSNPTILLRSILKRRQLSLIGMPTLNGSSTARESVSGVEPICKL